MGSFCGGLVGERIGSPPNRSQGAVLMVWWGPCGIRQGEPFPKELELGHSSEGRKEGRKAQGWCHGFCGVLLYANRGWYLLICGRDREGMRKLFLPLENKKAGERIPGLLSLVDYSMSTRACKAAASRCRSSQVPSRATNLALSLAIHDAASAMVGNP